jgi:hypothetical protein
MNSYIDFLRSKIPQAEEAGFTPPSVMPMTQTDRILTALKTIFPAAPWNHRNQYHNKIECVLAAVGRLSSLGPCLK